MNEELDNEGLRILRGLLMREYNWDAFKLYGLWQKLEEIYQKEMIKNEYKSEGLR